MVAAPSFDVRATLRDEEITGPTRPIDIGLPSLRDRAVLIETGGDHNGRPHRLGDDEVTIGRGRDCRLRLDDETLSRVHARIVRVGDEFVLRDAGSLNGCFVNDRRASETKLSNGDRLRFGRRSELRFHLVNEDEIRALERLYEGSAKDGLTGIANRKKLDEQLVAELSFAERHRTELSVVMVDIDHFKRINDVHGHLGGDEVLRRTAELLARTIRTEDLVARFGGEEFCVVARGIALAGARMLAERLRSALERAEIALPGGRVVRVTASFGAASLACCGTDRSVVRLVSVADRRLYDAKALGRNRVVAE